MASDNSHDGQDLAPRCRLCGRPLDMDNRSTREPNICKMCAGEQDDLNDDIDDFK